MTIAKLPALFLVALLCCAPALAASDPEALAKALDVVNHRLDQLEQQNRQLSEKVDELTRQNQTLRANAAPAAAAPVASAASAAPAVASSVASASASAAPAAAPREEWESR